MVAGHPHAVEHLALFVMLGRVERPLQVVQHRQQIAQQVALRPVAGLDQLARRPLAIVVELGPQAQQRVGQGVALRWPGRPSRVARPVAPARRSAAAVGPDAFGRVPCERPSAGLSGASGS